MPRMVAQRRTDNHLFGTCGSVVRLERDSVSSSELYRYRSLLLDWQSDGELRNLRLYYAVPGVMVPYGDLSQAVMTELVQATSSMAQRDFSEGKGMSRTSSVKNVN